MRKTARFLSFLACFCLVFEQTGFAQLSAQADISARAAASVPAETGAGRFRPLHLRSLLYDETTRSFRVQLDRGEPKASLPPDVNGTAEKLLSYFLIGLALPNDAFWVNLRPDSQDNIIDPGLERTDAGRILLEADVQLKKDLALFTSPETKEGRKYWDRLYRKAGELYGNADLTIPTLSRPWIVPGDIIVRESGRSAYVYKATLRVMLEQDRLSSSATYSFSDPRQKELNEFASALIKELILPRLIKEINTSRRYAALRQVYYSLVLAQWFKARFAGKDVPYARLIDTRDLRGLESAARWSKSVYYAAYRSSFEKGEYDLKNVSEGAGTVRSYTSGGVVLNTQTIPAASTGVTGRWSGGGTEVLTISGPETAPAAGNIDLSFSEGSAPGTVQLSAMRDGGNDQWDRYYEEAAIDALTGRDGPDFYRFQEQVRRIQPERVGDFMRMLLENRIGRGLRKDPVVLQGRGEETRPSHWEQTLYQAFVLNAFQDLNGGIAAMADFLRTGDPGTVEQETVWRQLEALAQRGHAPEVLSGLTARGFTVGWMAQRAVEGRDTQSVPASVQQSLLIILGSLISDEHADPGTKREAERRLLENVVRDIDQGRRVNPMFMQSALPGTILSDLEPQTAGEDLTDPAVQPAQMLLFTRSFQQLYDIITQNRPVTFRQALDMLGVRPREGGLFREQRLILEKVLLRTLARRLEYDGELNDARRQYPELDRYAALSQQMDALLQEEYDLGKAGGQESRLARVRGDIAELERTLAQAREAVDGFFLQRFGMHAPARASLTAGALSFRLELDARSLEGKQRQIRSESPQSSQGAQGARRTVRLNEEQRAALEDELRRLMDSLPRYGVGDFENEIFAYLMSNMFRTRNFNDIMEYYRWSYRTAVEQMLSWSGFSPETSQLIMQLSAEVWTQAPWEEVKQELMWIKRLIDEITDIRATIIFRQLSAASPSADRQELEAAAFRQAQQFAGGMLLSPARSGEALEAVLALSRDELRRAGIPQSAVLHQQEDAPMLTDFSQTPDQDVSAQGFMLEDVVYYEFGMPADVLVHEEAHVIYSLFSGQEASNHTPGIVDFVTQLNDKVGKYEDPFYGLRGFSFNAFMQAGGQRDGGSRRDVFGAGSSERPVAGRAQDDTKGGIDFRRLPVISERIPSLDLSSAELRRLARIDIPAERARIMKLLKGGLSPSTERLKEYVLACCVKRELVPEMGEVLACLAAVLRHEEEEAEETDATVRGLLVLVETAGNLSGN